MITSLVYAAFFGYNGDHKFQISLLMKIAFAVLYVHARSRIGLHKITLIFLQVIHCSLKLRICHPPLILIQGYWLSFLLYRRPICY
jgi:hypothetical protein